MRTWVKVLIILLPFIRTVVPFRFETRDENRHRQDLASSDSLVRRDYPEEYVDEEEDGEFATYDDYEDGDTGNRLVQFSRRILENESSDEAENADTNDTLDDEEESDENMTAELFRADSWNESSEDATFLTLSDAFDT